MCELIFKISHRPDGKIANVLAFDSRLHNCGRSTTECTCRKDLNFSHRPDGKMADMPKSTLIFQNGSIFGSYQGRVRASHACKFPIAPMGDSRFARCLQGGGVYVEVGTVTISSCTISGNTATYVHAHAQKFPSPQWETHVLLVAYRAVVSQSSEAQ
jgi:hypothetical protein